MSYVGESIYKIWFVTSTLRFEIPVNPSELTIQYPGESTNYNVVGIGEIVVPRLPKLRQLSIESFFPKAGGLYQTYVNTLSFYRPEDYVKIFTDLQKRREVFRIIITRSTQNEPALDTNISVILNDFSVTDKGGEPGDLYFSMTLSEWKDPKPERLEVISPGEEGANGETIKPIQMVRVKQRTIPANEVCVGKEVEVSGKVYENENMLESAWSFSRRTLSGAQLVVSRVLPKLPFGEYISGELSEANRILVEGIGWVNKSDCYLGSANNLSTMTSGNSIDGHLNKGLTAIRNW